MIRISIVDDEKIIREKISSLVSETLAAEPVEAELRTYPDGESFLGASGTDGPSDILLADTALKDIVRGFEAPKVSIQLIQQIVADYYDIDVEGLLSQRRTADITYPRQIAMFLCREMTGDSLKTIGKHFGGRDYSTVISAYNKIMADLKKDPELGLTLDDLRKRIKK